VTDEAMSPLRRRMIEDMTIRKLAPKTQHDYVQRVKNFAAFLGRSPDTASFEDVRRYQLHLAASGVGVPSINQTVSTLRFFFRVTLKRHEIGFLPWRLSDAGRRTRGAVLHAAGIRNPSQFRPCAAWSTKPEHWPLTDGERICRTPD
jgi:site-specific recombinase XerD